MITKNNLDQEELKRLSVEFEKLTTQEILSWAVDQFFPRLGLACSFGAEDVALVDMIVKIQPAVRIFYLDTEFLFPETENVRRELIQRYGIQPIAYKPALSPADQDAVHGEKLYQRNPDACCRMRKVEPLKSALKELSAWITGIRRDQSPTRVNAALIEWDSKFELVKLNPLARWTTADVWNYIRSNNVPYNVLHDHGYPSIGCIPCTRSVLPGEDPRSGRWAGFAKTECGLHGDNQGGGK